MNHIKIEFTNERIVPASGLSVVGAILGKSDFVKCCNRMDVTPNRSQHQIKNGDILLTLKISRFPAREKQYIPEVTGNRSPIP